jgi:hypothetical protein
LSKLFNIVGTSVALLAHFAANPVAHSIKRGHHRLVLANLATGPIRVPLRNLQHVKGHCYAFEVDQNLITDGFASSTLLVFEDGKPLKLRHSRDPEKIAAKGGGRMVHDRNRVYFSTPDNSSPLTNGREYFALHSPTENAAKFNALHALQKTSTKTGAARLAEMMAILCPRHFAFAAAEGEGPGVVLRQVRIAIDSKAEIVLASERLTVEQAPAGDWSFTLDGLRTVDGEMRPLTIRGSLDLAPSSQRWIRELEITGQGGLALGMTFSTEGAISLTAARPDLLRAPLLENFRDEAELQAWIAQAFDRLCDPLSEGGFGLEFDAATRAAFFEILAAETPPSRYAFSTTTAPENRKVKLERFPLAG